MIRLADCIVLCAGGREKSTDEFRTFTKQLYHMSLAQILSPLRPAMTTPHVMQCPDGHYRRAIFELGPFIADYPEQVCLAGIVWGWCPKYVPRSCPDNDLVTDMRYRCRAYPEELDKAGSPRFRAHTETLVDTFMPRVLWDVFGVHSDVTVSNPVHHRAYPPNDLTHTAIHALFPSCRHTRAALPGPPASTHQGHIQRPCCRMDQRVHPHDRCERGRSGQNYRAD